MTEGNKIIAEFMGLPSYENMTGKYWLHPLDKNKEVSQFNYHTSWDWIMPVVEKIFDIAPVDVRARVDCSNQRCLRGRRPIHSMAQQPKQVTQKEKQAIQKVKLITITSRSTFEA